MQRPWLWNADICTFAAEKKSTSALKALFRPGQVHFYVLAKIELKQLLILQPTPD